ncbi:MAG: hypothetical protein JO316_24320 [Abitibacteriaceae bacterium]|nr:hypothetical protein [Abditibacteriaceae bacterium]MBV9868493.1 hypothetical protein [Abditibacteriaceae bacterium]
MAGQSTKTKAKSLKAPLRSGGRDTSSLDDPNDSLAADETVAEQQPDQAENIGFTAEDRATTQADNAQLDDAVQTPDSAAKTISQEDLVKELPEEVLAFLVRSTPQRSLWEWLSEDKRASLLHNITRGFQRTANALRQPVVRSRFIRHIYEHLEDFREVLKLWGEAHPAPHVVTEVRALTDDTALIEQLTDLWQRHGGEAVLLTLLLDNRNAALEALDVIAEPEMADEAESTGNPDEIPIHDGFWTGQHLNRRGETRRAEQRRTLLRRQAPRREADPPESDIDPLAQAQSEVRQWQARAAQAEQNLQTTQSVLTTTQRELSEAHEQLRAQAKTHQRESQHNQQRIAADESQLQETKRSLDRITRRWKSLQKESEDLAADNKRFKRQMRRQQQLNEELRKQLANVTARLQTLSAPPSAPTPAPAATPQAGIPQSKTTAKGAAKGAAKAPAKTPAPTLAPRPQVLPLDQLFLWQSDGRQFRVTPREVKRAIDRNDEEFVFTLIQAFDALRETNEPGYRMFIDRIREFDRYYSRVLTVDTTRVLVDVSNVARYEPNRYGKGQLRHLLVMRDELRRRDCFPIIMYADASLPYHIDEPNELMQMVKNGEVQMTTSGQEADELLAREARRTGAYVVTNDRTFHTKVSPDFEPPRVTFRIHDGFLIVDDF